MNVLTLAWKEVAYVNTHRVLFRDVFGKSDGK